MRHPFTAEAAAQTMIRRYHLNAQFALFCCVVFAIGLAAMNSQNNLLFWIFGVMVAALFMSGLVSGAMMLGLRVRRIDPRHGRVGEALIVRYAIENRNRILPAFNLHVEDLQAAPRDGGRTWFALLRGMLRRPLHMSEARLAARRAWRERGPATFWKRMAPVSSWVMHVGPRDTVHGEAVFWPTRRGVADFHHVRLWSAFPFGLVKKSITFEQPAHTLIYPRVYELRRGVVDALRPRGPLGARVGTRAGQGDEYYGLREYREGDLLTHVAWKRTASLDELVCIERTRPSPPRLRVVVDLRRPTADLRVDESVDARRLEEDTISLAASLIVAAESTGYEVGLTVVGVPVDALPARGGAWHVDRLLGALAIIDLDGPRSPHAGVIGPEGESAGLVVIHPDRVDPSIGRREDAWHLTGDQLARLGVRAVGWQPDRPPSEEAAA
jgi:uncharacterized protein (DUF58 family)